MKNIFALVILGLLICGCKQEDKKNPAPEHDHATMESQEKPKNVLSPHTSAMAMIGDAHVHIDYSSPGVRNRVIFGGLLAYDEVWQAGAHMATWIETDKDLVFQDKTLKAGKYGFFAIPSREKWTLIFNTRWNQHGKDEYTAAEDVLRLQVDPETTDSSTEQLTYSVEETSPGQGMITLAWDTIRVQLPFTVIQE